MKEYKSVCPYDCPDACGLIVSVENNKVVSVRGNKDHAFTRGTLCPKMVHYEKVIPFSIAFRIPYGSALEKKVLVKTNMYVLAGMRR